MSRRVDWDDIISASENYYGCSSQKYNEFTNTSYEISWGELQFGNMVGADTIADKLSNGLIVMLNVHSDSVVFHITYQQLEGFIGLPIRKFDVKYQEYVCSYLFSFAQSVSIIAINELLKNSNLFVEGSLILGDVIVPTLFPISYIEINSSCEKTDHSRNVLSVLPENEKCLVIKGVVDSTWIDAQDFVDLSEGDYIVL